MDTTRLAPSPTGALHLGNARTFLVNWLLARQNGWRIVLRIEDLDGPRVKRGADEQAIEDLRWLGIDWDEGPIYQSRRIVSYRKALEKLLEQGDAYFCGCTRQEVESSQSAPHAEDGSVIYPGTCRKLNLTDPTKAVFAFGGAPKCVRFKNIPGSISFTDQFCGPQSFDAPTRIGDFVIGKLVDAPSYQLAVVVDDAAMGVTDVVRGDDLLDSAARQMLLYGHLKLGDPPRYWHLPLVVGPDGKRLAKRHGDTRISFYRQQGVSAGRVRALLGRWCGIEHDDEISVEELLARFSIERIPRQRIIMKSTDAPIA
ncbi:MAG TPA: tRNA glutamyl-Q(34) synthetase GluQRS [Tepidisphaeraceae bacterium]|jgi:glutamyl-tRNA synthetase